MSVNLPKAFIFGAGSAGRHILQLARTQFKVEAFLDNDKEKQGQIFEGLPVYAPKILLETDYEMIIVASNAGVNTITEQLLKLGLDNKKIYTGYIDLTVKSRIAFLESLGKLFNEKGITGSVAECGVFMGEFAKEINRIFSQSKLYLFDTFSGFDERDIVIEKANLFSGFNAGHLNVTHESIVINNLLYPERAIIKKGYFPDTAEGINDAFCFVNLDFDLYAPTLAGLEYFSSRMVKGGGILIHDYFSDAFKGIRAAVNDFNKEKEYKVIPIGDMLSVYIPF